VDFRKTDMVEIKVYDMAYIKSVLDDLKKKGIEASTIAEVLSAPKKIVSLSIIRERFRK